MSEPAESTHTSLPIRRVFLSSTALDLVAHRSAVADAVLRLGNLPVRMESFGARPNTPVAVCEQKVRESDAVVVILAHRYGFVPPAEIGGRDGKSMTWLEVEAALSAKRQVFAFIVDQTYPWVEPKEQDRLQQPDVLADSNKIRDIAKAVEDLQRFRSWLRNDAGLVVDSFTSPADLATKVTAALAAWALESLARGVLVSEASTSVRPPDFRVIHPLQPAPHFKGRATEVADLIGWWRDPAHPDRVRALIAAGGTGKTAIIDRVLCRARTLEQRGHTLVWSFYENPNVGAFLREACALFLDESDGPAGGRLERLQRGLREGRPHILVLDGLERFQAAARGHHALGEIEDYSLRMLLRAVAAGLGRTRALVSSRLPVSSLDPWRLNGYSMVRLDDLDLVTALEVFRAWGVKGDDATLEVLGRDIGCHALSVSVLGSFLSSFGEGDPAFADRLELRREAGDDQQAARLARILHGYAERLPAPELDLLVRLSTFPQGASVTLLRAVAGASRKIAGTLAHCDEAHLHSIAHRLTVRGLIFTYNSGTEPILSAHPFLRDWFRELLGRREKLIHKAVQRALASELKDFAQPRWNGWGDRKAPFPSDEATLDRYESLIEHTRLSGNERKAFQFYFYGLGSVSHLVEELGQITRGARILAAFSDVVRPEGAAPTLNLPARTLLLNAYGLCLMLLGQLELAQSQFAICERLADRRRGDTFVIAPILLNMAVVALHRGRLPEAYDLARRAYSKGASAWVYKDYLQDSASVVLGEIELLLGAHSEHSANHPPGINCYTYPGARHQMDISDWDAVRREIETDLDSCMRLGHNRRVANYHAHLAYLSLQRTTEEATHHLAALRNWTAKTGEMESVIEAHRLGADLARQRGDLIGARDEALLGLNNAEACGYGLLRIELLTLLAQVELAWPDARAGLENASLALELATAENCSYVWGEADAAHSCGEAHFALGEPEQAVFFFAQALAVRERIRHPATSTTREALARCRHVLSDGFA